MTRARAALRRRLSDDSGFGLVEAVVAAMVLMLFATGVYGTLTSTLGVSKVDRQRVAASSLAQREVEAARGSLMASKASALSLVQAGRVANPLTPGSTTASATASVVDGVAYTVTRTASWTVRGTGSNSCDGGTAVKFPNVLLSVAVTWPDMKSVQPVVNRTVVAPPKNLLSSTYAFVAVPVVTYANAVVAGRTVTATGPETQVQTTDASGCALFGFATAGAYTFTLNEPGWVDFSGNVVSSKPLTVTAGSFTRLTAMTYDRSAALSADTTSPTGYPLPQTPVDVSIYNTKLPAGANARSAATSGAVGSFTDVAPWSDGYVVYAGSCSDANPVLAPTSGARPVTVVAPGGTAAHVAAALAPVHVQYPTATAGLAVSATSQATTCSTAQRTLQLGTTTATGGLDTSLPYGRWKVTVGARSSAVFNPPASGALTNVPVL